MLDGEVSVIPTARGPVEFFEEGTGPVVLCIHGAMGGFDQSITLGRTIGDPGYRYIAVSRPGYLGTPVRSGRTAEQQGELHAALLDSLGVEKAIVMAISGGGPSAMHFALAHPNRCSKLVLCSTVGTPAQQNIPISFHMMTMLAGIPPVVRALHRKTAGDLKAAVSRSITDPDLLEKTMKDPEVMELFKVVLLGSFERMSQRIAGTRMDIKASATFSCNLERIAAPTLVIHGDRDPLVPFVGHGQVLAQRIPDARLCLVSGGEHVAIFTHRQQVRAAVRDFLA